MTSTLVFPSALESFHLDRQTIRSNLRDTYNRLHSIASDAEFISSLRPSYADFQIIPNLRAGAWYVRPEHSSPKPHFPTNAGNVTSPRKTSSGLHKVSEALAPASESALLAAASTKVVCTASSVNPALRRSPPRAYFKSTDGHTGQTDFNLRRANLALLKVILEDGGMVLVDSTRRGKRFPDALSKTLPIWCAVLNLARQTLLPVTSENADVTAEEWDKHGRFWTLESAVSRSEHAVIERKIAGWAEKLATSSYDLGSLRLLRRPLRPIFISPSSSSSASTASSSSTHYYPIVLASASKLASEEDGLERAEGYTYVQGSGDDHEAWSRGLDPITFWDNSDEILSASRDEIDAVIADILTRSASGSKAAAETDSISPPPSKAKELRGSGVWADFCSCQTSSASFEGSSEPERTVILVQSDFASSPTSPNPAPSSKDESSRPISINIRRPGKLGHNAFFEKLKTVVDTVLEVGGEVEVRVPEGDKDAADAGAATVLALLVRLANSEGEKRSTRQGVDPDEPVTKPLIRTRLEWLLEAFPSLNPSRTILNRVNEYLISNSKGQRTLRTPIRSGI